MNSHELFQIHENLCKKALELMTRKNHDYSGKSGNEPFANFTRAEAMGITTTEKGMLVRMLDKMSRLSSFCDSGEFKVQDEKLEDTILDIINYSILLYAYIESKKDIKQMKFDFSSTHDLVALDIPRDKGNIDRKATEEDVIPMKRQQVRPDQFEEVYP